MAKRDFAHELYKPCRGGNQMTVSVTFGCASLWSMEHFPCVCTELESPQLARQIKHDFYASRLRSYDILHDLGYSVGPPPNINWVTVHAYYGTYDGVVVMAAAYEAGTGFGPMVRSFEVAGYTFSYRASSTSIYAWKDGEFLPLDTQEGYPPVHGEGELPGAYDLGWLTERDIADIHEHHLALGRGGLVWYDDPPDVPLFP
jgi:hypothetical protein